jgi:TRAP-type C4-dicarboxylate transport system substrate-binding protein
MQFSKVIVSGLALALLATTTAQAQEITLKAGVFVPPQTVFGVPFQRFVTRVNETGKGKVQISLVGGPAAIPPPGQGEAVKNGVLDMAAVPPTFYKSLMVEGDAQSLTDQSLAEQRASGAYKLLDELSVQKLNAYYLTTYGIGIPFHIYLTREIAKTDELKGLRLRGQPIYSAVFKHFGVTGVTIAPAESYTALERGVVQGYGWPIWGIQDFGWDKLTKQRIDPGFYNVIVNIIVNKPRFDGLNAEQKKVLQDAASAFEKDEIARTAETTKQNIAHQQSLGIKVLDLGAGFRKTATDLLWADLEPLSPDNIKKLKQLLAK